ncbi:MAG: BlaI/MecI/CopY family transcriptional regulator [Lachnospiraceae bacterium]|nr:BlaI/MecI/CopY family transcriptional regulator [Lachnospiraceae bacterium]
MQYHAGLSENEWYIMQVLWDRSPAGLRDICGALQEKKKWSRHAVTSFLNRLLEKGAISVDESGKVRQYRAVWGREETVREETASILERVYHGDLFCMVSNAVKGGERFSQEEIEELKKMLDSMGEAKEK